MLFPTKKVSSKITAIQIRHRTCNSCNKLYFYLDKDEIEAATTGLIGASKDETLAEIVQERLMKKLKSALSKPNTESFCPYCFKQPTEHFLKRQFSMISGSLLIGVFLGGGMSAWIIPFTGLDVSNIIYYMIYSALAVALILYLIMVFSTKPEMCGRQAGRTIKSSMKINELQEWIQSHENPVKDWYFDINMTDSDPDPDEEDEIIIDLGIDDATKIDNKIPSTESLIRKVDEEGLQSLMFYKSYLGF